MTNPEPPTQSAKTTQPKAGLRTEHDFLDAQAEEAKVAISDSIAAAKEALAHGMDPKLWAKRYPLIALGSAIAAGFAAAAIAIPSKEQQELRRIRKIHEALHPPAPAPAPETKTKTEEKPSFLHGLLHESMHLIRPLLTTLLTSGLSQVIAPDQHAHTNGDLAADAPAAPSPQSDNAS